MESGTRLDYVLFQLTPTRTRCDLVMFAGKSSEKLAFGLLDPFLSHLRTAKDQIGRGGYSITLRPPARDGSKWFTKGTLQRFVRFVSTPEVLERFVTIEREIEQIDGSILSYEASNANGAADADGNAYVANGTSKHASAPLKPKGESDGSSDAIDDENSISRLQRVLETRKAVLRKEQAMVFARALAAGFDMDYLGDLISFSDAFGASRLRDACVAFMSLYKKKNEDRLWRDEVAAMQAFPQAPLAYTGASGIMLAGEDVESTQNFMAAAGSGGIPDISPSESTNGHGSLDVNPDQKAQMPYPWANIPQYPHNFQGPVYQQMPPYQGYVYPGMPYFPGNLQWPGNFQDSAPAVDREADRHSNRRSSSKKKDRASSRRGSEKEDSDDHSEPSNSSSESDSSEEHRHRKKHGKKSSKKVVIRNINYITSRDGEKAGTSQDDSSDENGFLAAESLKQQVEEAVGSFEKQHKSSSSQRRRNKNLASKDSSNGSDNLLADAELPKSDVEQKGSGTGNWDFLQELLMKEEPDSNRHEQAEGVYQTTKQAKEPNSSTFDLQAEETRKQKPISTDSFLVAGKELGSDDRIGRSSFRNFEAGDDIYLIPRRGGMPDEFVVLRHEETQKSSYLTLSDCANESSTVKIHGSDDWIVGTRSDRATNGDQSIDLAIVDGNYSSFSSKTIEKNRKETSDDSFIIQARSTDNNFDSQLRTDISMVSDFIGGSVTEHGSSEVQQGNSASVGFYEPSELYMVLDRDAVVEQTVIAWNPEMDFETSKPTTEACTDQSIVEACVDPSSVSDGKGVANGKSGLPNAKINSKDAKTKGSGRPTGKGKPEALSGNQKPAWGSRASIPNGKLNKEEEVRKRREEILLQRQKRIAEKSTVTGRSSGIPKKPLDKATPVINRAAKTNTQGSSADEQKKETKSVFRSSTIERLAAARTTQKVTATPIKSGLPKKESPKASKGQPKAVREDNEKLNRTKSGSSDTKIASEDVSAVNASISDAKVEKLSKDEAVGLPLNVPTREEVHVAHIANDSEDIKELHVTSSTTNGDADLPVSNGSHSVISNSIKTDVVVQDVQMLSLDDMKSHNYQGELAISVPQSAKPDLVSPFIVQKEDKGIVDTPGYLEISEIEESTPATFDGMNPDPTYTRKKWDTSENSPKASNKGIRKLLMFGRKS
ncbi:hypothetical protein Droror1_Dr00014193 [Drosera rotundifolia]